MSNFEKRNNFKKTKPIIKQEKPKVTDLETLKKYVDNGTIVELPSFDDDTPFVVKLRRPSLMAMIAEGYIPNGLQPKAIELFESNVKEAQDVTDIKDIYELLTVFAKACLMSPTFEELESVGLKLTDEQLMLIYQFSQRGTRALEPFRAEQALAKIVDSIGDVQKKA